MKKTSIFLIIACFLTTFTFIAGCKADENSIPQAIISDAGGEKNLSPLRVFIDVEYGSNIYLSLKNELTEYMVE